jgi:hypothetical protein
MWEFSLGCDTFSPKIASAYFEKSIIIEEA